MAALMFSAACGQSNSALDPKYTSNFTPRNHFCQLFAITKSASRRLRKRRKLCVKNVASDKKQEIEEPVTEGALNSFVPDSASVASSIKYHAEFMPSFSPEKFELSKPFFATAESVRDTLIINRNTTCAYYYEKMNVKQAYYTSMEYLQGRALLNAIGNLQLTGPYAEALTALGHNLEDVANQDCDYCVHLIISMSVISRHFIYDQLIIQYIFDNDEDIEEKEEDDDDEDKEEKDDGDEQPSEKDSKMKPEVIFKVDPKGP